MKAPLRQRREAAEMLAIQALGFIAGDSERLADFLNMTGIAAADIRLAAGEPSFLAGVLEHMLADESLLLAFAADAGIDPAEVARAKSVLTTDWERDVP
jgi:hypothetical protein